MTFRRAIYFSFAFHALLFGAALAFAHFGLNLFSGSGRVLSVSLVDSPGMSGAGGKAGRGAAGRPRIPVPAGEAAVPVPPTEQPAPNALPDEGIAPSGNAGESAERGPDGASAGSSGTGAGAGAGSGDGDGKGLIGLISREEWRLIQSALERSKTYPRLARERGIEGVVLVRFKVSSAGSVEKVDIVKSSGSPVLDEATVRTVYRAAPLPGVNGWVEVPVSYVLTRQASEP